VARGLTVVRVWDNEAWEEERQLLFSADAAICCAQETQHPRDTPVSTL